MFTMDNFDHSRKYLLKMPLHLRSCSVFLSRFLPITEISHFFPLNLIYHQENNISDKILLTSSTPFSGDYHQNGVTLSVNKY